jgi:hypothetical protein
MTSQKPDGIRRPMPKFAAGIPFLFVQCVCMSLLIWSDTSDGYARSYGPNWPYVILLLGGYLLTLFFGALISLLNKEWLTLLIQVAIPIGLTAFIFWPNPVYDVRDLQYLKSKTPAEVEAALGTRGRLTGAGTYRGRSRNFWSYDGVTIYFTNDGYTADEIKAQRVFAIEANQARK